MWPGTRSFVALGCAVAAYVGPSTSAAQAQQLRIENVYPRQLPPGETAVINVVIATRDDIQSVEISPSHGVTVSAITRGETFQGALTWSSITIDVAKDAMPGERSLVVQLPAGRTAPTALTVPSHVPRIANLRVVAVRPNPQALHLEMAATDPSADLGDAPHVWFMMACGDMPLPGVVRGTVMRRADSGSLVNAVLPVPPSRTSTPAASKCDLQLRVADAPGHESNTLRTTVDLASRSSPGSIDDLRIVRTPPNSPSDQEWTEIVSREERFTLTFPGKPTVTDTMWMSQYGAAIPSRVYGLVKGQSRYSAAIVDYNPVERLLVERSRACPPGANTCQGIADWGVGYWKTDIRGALLYAISKFAERDAKITTLSWNGIALVQGVELRLTNTADQSRTFASIYMHENRLVIVEATVSAGDPPPVAFNESLNWLDDQGRPVRYQGTYVNIPDVPKPLPRGAPAPAAASSP
jgi:hypothetical protein